MSSERTGPSTRHAGDRIKREALPLSIDDIVEECAELSACEAHTGVGHGLNQPLKIEFGRNTRDGLVQSLKVAFFCRKVVRDPMLLGDVGVGPEPARDAPVFIPE